MKRGPLPYDVGIFLDEEILYFEAPSAGEAKEAASPEGSAVYMGGADDVLAMLQNAVAVDRPVVSQARVLSARGRRQALEEARDLDLLLAVGFETPRQFSSQGWPWYWAATEITSWLFGGIPSWFVPSVRYPTETHLTVECIDLHQKRVRQWLAGQGSSRGVPAFDWRETLDAPSQDVSLFDRSSPMQRPGDYALTILVPPVLVEPGDPARLSRSLTDGVNEDLSQKLAIALRQRLLDEETTKPLRVAFVAPNPLQEVEDDSMNLALGLSTSDRVKVTALEVSRLAPGARRFLWKAAREDLARINAALGELAQADDYSTVKVPQAIPLQPGMNVVKVRVFRQDGEGAVRTMVYFH
jgi:hypothetical protein